MSAASRSPSAMGQCCEQVVMTVRCYLEHGARILWMIYDCTRSDGYGERMVDDDAT